MMYLFVIILEIIIFLLSMFFIYLADENDNAILGICGIILFISLLIIPSAMGKMHGYINYLESNDKDKARITAITQEQNWLRAYYKIEVEYLTNTPTQSGVVTNYNIEKDTYYCYITDKELVEQIQNNLYKELWIISGHKGGYENYKDFGTKLLKRIEFIEEEN